MKNQTDENLLVDVSTSTKGNGVFALPDKHWEGFGSTNWHKTFDSNVYGSVRKAVVSNITYLDCVHRGNQIWIIAFKWIPKTVVSYQELVAAAGSCGNVLCVKRCAAFGCLCIDGECK